MQWTDEAPNCTEPRCDALVHVGDFFCESWGYDQTNIDYYQVLSVSKSGKTVTMRRVRTELVDGRRVSPLRNQWYDLGRSSTSGILRKSIRSYGPPENRSVYVRMTSYSSASLWDGAARYDTIAAGDPGH